MHTFSPFPIPEEGAVKSQAVLRIRVTQRPAPRITSALPQPGAVNLAIICWIRNWIQLKHFLRPTLSEVMYAAKYRVQHQSFLPLEGHRCVYVSVGVGGWVGLNWFNQSSVEGSLFPDFCYDRQSSSEFRYHPCFWTLYTSCTVKEQGTSWGPKPLTQSVVVGQTALESPGRLVEMQNLRLHPGLTESESSF